VSFCDSVQIEEIEPNSNKSIFRTTPRVPSSNKAKLVLSPYFTTPQANTTSHATSSTTNGNLIDLMTNSPSANTAPTNKVKKEDLDSACACGLVVLLVVVVDFDPSHPYAQ
jgi:hypothetical protein